MGYYDKEGPLVAICMMRSWQQYEDQEKNSQAEGNSRSGDGRELDVFSRGGGKKGQNRLARQEWEGMQGNKAREGARNWIL